MSKAAPISDTFQFSTQTVSPPAASSPTDNLAAYFRDLSEFDLLAAEEELHIAQSIEEQERRTWTHLLSYAPAVDYLLKIVEARIDNSLSIFRTLRSAALNVRNKTEKKAQAKLTAVATQTAKQMRALDQDRSHLDNLFSKINSLANASNHSPLPFFPLTKSFADYAGKVRISYRRANQLRDEFVRANLRLVVTMARRYDRGIMPLSDLIQEGNLGLIHAVSRFDYRRGLRFSTYACWWIRHAIGRALADKARTVRIPVHMLEAQQQLAKVKQDLTRKLGRIPTRGEIAGAAEIPVNKLNQMNRFLLGRAVSMDRPNHTEEGRTLGDTIPDPSTEEWSAADALTMKTMNKRVQELMTELSPIEADVLKQRFGLIDDQEHTFREIGDQYNLSRERIRQIQNTALHKLRKALERKASPGSY